MARRLERLAEQIHGDKNGVCARKEGGDGTCPLSESVSGIFPPLLLNHFVPDGLPHSTDRLAYISYGVRKPDIEMQRNGTTLPQEFTAIAGGLATAAGYFWFRLLFMLHNLRAKS